MEKCLNLDKDCCFFSSKILEDVVVLNFKQNILSCTTDLSAGDTLIDYLGSISRSDSIKVVVFIGSPQKSGDKEYIEFYNESLKSTWNQYKIQRMCNVVDQFILSIVDLNKIVVHANSGRVISLFLNVSLACDYRIVADNTIFQNPCLKLGFVSKGGGPFFLSKRLGLSKAYEILLSEKDITAHEALRLGIVDKIVPLNGLEEAALEVAHRFAQKPASTLAGVKKLLNYSMKDLRNYFELENQELLRIVGPSYWS